MSDRRRDQYLGLGVESEKTDVACCCGVRLPGRCDDTEAVELVLSRECEIAHFDILEERKLNGVSADGQLGDLRQFVLAVKTDQIVDGLSDDLVGDLSSGIHPEVHVIHDVRSGERVSGCNCCVENLAALVEIDKV